MSIESKKKQRMAEVEAMFIKPTKPPTKKRKAEYLEKPIPEMPLKQTKQRMRFLEMKDEMQDFLDAGHGLTETAERFGFSYEALRSFFRREQEKEGAPLIRVNHRVMRQKVDLPPMVPLPVLIPGESYRLVSGVHSGGFAADDCEKMRFVREVKAPHATGGRLFMFESVGGCIESFTEYQIRTCFGAKIPHHGGATKAPSLLRMGREEAA
jgi:hypothetical protein